MAEDSTRAYLDKAANLSKQITLMKMRLIAKYGPKVAEAWRRR